jgi:hypothetical protein
VYYKYKQYYKSFYVAAKEHVKPIVSVFEACVALDAREKWMADRPYLLMNDNIDNVDNENTNIEGACVFY